jgi:hypothetical protein
MEMTHREPHQIMLLIGVAAGVRGAEPDDELGDAAELRRLSQQRSG